MKISNIKFYKRLVDFIFSFILGIYVFGRPFLGIYIFGFRVGEYLVAFSILFYFYTIYKFKYFKKELGSITVYFNFFIVLQFIILTLIDSSNLINTYIFKTSSYIWYVSLFYLGYEIFKNFEIKKNYFYFGYLGLLIQFVINTIYFPNFLLEFFSTYSDKVDFIKGAELSISFLVITFFSNRYFKEGKMIDFFLIFSSAFVPLISFKSRSAAIAIIIYVIFELINNKTYFLSNLKRFFLVLLVSIFIFSYTSHSLVDNSFEIEETNKAITQVFKHKYITSNTFDRDVSIIYFYEGRLYSADGNLNWRFQLWQDALNISFNESSFIFGDGFSERHDVFENIKYRGLDGLNENIHNFFLNIFLKQGIVGLILFGGFFFYLTRNPINSFTKKDILIFFLTLMFISMFDGSMENPYFGATFYFFLSSFFSGIKFKEEI